MSDAEWDSDEGEPDAHRFESKPRTDLPYEAALHAIQSGIALLMTQDPTLVEPKHLRVGIDSAMVTDAALARLLVRKGLFTEAEYAEEIRLEACREVDRLEARLTALTDATKITLR